MRTLALCLAFVLTTLVHADDWPFFRGPTTQGISSDKGLPLAWGATQNVVWKVDLPGPGTSSPITFKDHIYLTYYTGYGVPGKAGGSLEQLQQHLACMNRADGKLLWTKTVATKQPEQARIREDHGYASNTPAADAERIYAFFGKSGVYAFSHEGKELWHAEVGSTLNGWGTAASPILFEDKVIINASVESESLVALDKKTGKELWRAKGIREAWNTPLLVNVEGKPELIVAVIGKILAFDPANGQPLWNCYTDISWYMVPSLVANDGIIYAIGGRSGGSLAVRAGGKGDVTRTHRLWKGNKGSNVSSPLYHEGHLYWMNDNLGVAYCAEAKTGKLVYEERIDRAGQVYASPVLADGRIYYLTRTGRTIVVPAAPKFEILAQNDFEDRSVFNASPAVSNGQLLIRSNQRLYCLGK